MVNNRKSNGNLVQFQRKKSSTFITSEASQIVSNQEYDMRRNEINQINNNHFTTLSRQNSSTNYDMDVDLKESILEIIDDFDHDTDDDTDDEFVLKEPPKIDTSLISEIVHFILNERSSKRSLSILVLSILK
jgi:hypothetical protein